MSGMLAFFAVTTIPSRIAQPGPSASRRGG